MNIVAFNGSLIVEGNTEILLKETLKPVQKGLHEIIFFKLNEMNIKPYQNCGGCERTALKLKL